MVVLDACRFAENAWRIHLAEQKELGLREIVHGMFAERCPVYRTLKPAIEITTELAFETE